MIDCRKVFNNNHTERAEKLRKNAEKWFAFFDNDTPDRGHYVRAINPIISRPTIRVGTCEIVRTSPACIAWVAPIYDYAECVALIIPDLALWIDKCNYSKTIDRHMDELIKHYELQCPSMTRFRRLNVQLAEDYEEEENDYRD